MSNANEFRKQDVQGLRKELSGLLKERFNLRVQQATGQLGRPHQIKEVKRKIAQIKTVINEKLKGDAE